MYWGITYSHRHMRALMPSGDTTAIYDQVLTERWDIVRLCAYWDEEIEQLIPLLEASERARQSVIVTLGIKAPRWPEYYAPGDTSEHQIAERLETLITRLRHYTCITHWQVENEPLDPSGPDDRSISYADLKRRVEIVRTLDPRPIVLTLWGNALASRRHLSQLSTIADIVGIDLYPRQYTGSLLSVSRYAGPDMSSHALHRLIRGYSHEVWVTELQAEPWEGSWSDYMSGRGRSMSDAIMRRHIAYARQIDPSMCLLWGWEWWYMRGRSGYLRQLTREVSGAPQ